MVPDTGILGVFVFTAVKDGRFPLPEAANPIAVLVLVQVKLVLDEGVLLKLILFTVEPLQYTALLIGVITGFGLTVMIMGDE